MEKTLVTFLLDRTGSMNSIKDDTIGGFNAYLKGLKESGAPIEFTLLQFDSGSLDKNYVCKAIAEVEDLTDATFQPRASTPLIDASYKTIKAVEESLTKRDDKPKVVICIMTDGFENASTEFTWDQLNALIKEKIALGWEFNFMGAGIDAYKQAGRMGLSVAQTMSYDSSDSEKTKRAFMGRSASVGLYASGMAANTHVSQVEKAAAGDKFDPALKSTAQPVVQQSPAQKQPIVDNITL